MDSGDVTLAVDSSSQTMSAALLVGGAVVSEEYAENSRHHAETIVTCVERVLNAAHMMLDDIDLFAVVTGPGAFTGLRVGISTVKGFAYALGKPVAAVSSLEALAYDVSSTPKRVCAMIDAKHAMVYAALYQCAGEGSMVALDDEAAVKPKEYLAKLSGDILFVGSGARIYAPLIEQTISLRAELAPHSCDRLRARSVGLIGLKKFHLGDIVDAMTLTPRYIRASYAEAAADTWTGESEERRHESV